MSFKNKELQLEETVNSFLKHEIVHRPLQVIGRTEKETLLFLICQTLLIRKITDEQIKRLYFSNFFRKNESYERYYSSDNVLGRVYCYLNKNFSDFFVETDDTKLILNYLEGNTLKETGDILTVNIMGDLIPEMIACVYISSIKKLKIEENELTSLLHFLSAGSKIKHSLRPAPKLQVKDGSTAEETYEKFLDLLTNLFKSKINFLNNLS